MANENTGYIRIKGYLTEHEIEYLERKNVDIGRAMVKVIKHYIKKEDDKESEERLSKRKMEVNNPIKEFLERTLVRTNNYYDTTPLMDIYDIYANHCLLCNLKPYTKQGLRKKLEESGYAYTTAGGNRMVFRFVRFKTNEDLEWEI